MVVKIYTRSGETGSMIETLDGYWEVLLSGQSLGIFPSIQAARKWLKEENLL